MKTLKKKYISSPFKFERGKLYCKESKRSFFFIRKLFKQKIQPSTCAFNLKYSVVLQNIIINSPIPKDNVNYIFFITDEKKINFSFSKKRLGADPNDCDDESFSAAFSCFHPKKYDLFSLSIKNIFNKKNDNTNNLFFGHLLTIKYFFSNENSKQAEYLKRNCSKF